MNARFNFSALILLLLFFACQKKQQETETIEQKAEVSAETVTSALPEIDDETFYRIAELQKQIMVNKNESELRRQYLKLVYLSDQKVLLNAGFGRLTSPETQQPIMKQYVDRAARIDASRWALYSRRWMENPESSEFGSIEGEFKGQMELLRQENIGDSLVVLFASPLQP